jgi:hypothetical protein
MPIGNNLTASKLESRGPYSSAIIGLVERNRTLNYKGWQSSEPGTALQRITRTEVSLELWMEREEITKRDSVRNEHRLKVSIGADEVRHRENTCQNESTTRGPPKECCRYKQEHGA